MHDSSFEVQRSVLVIEDEPKNFEDIAIAFKKFGWEIYPKEDDYRENWSKNYLNLRADKLTKFIRDYIEINYKSIGVIILDILLIRNQPSNQTGIDQVLPMIRNINIENKELHEWGIKVPIIALTRISPKEIARTALTNQEHVDAFFMKTTFNTEPNLLVFTAQSLFSTFRFRMQEGLHGIISEMYEALFLHLEQDNKAIISKLNHIDIILKGRFDDVENQLKFILNTLFVKMKNDDKMKIMQEFPLELKNSLGDERFAKIELSLKKSLKEDFKKFIEKGSMKDFVDFLTNLWNECEFGVLAEISFVKFIGYGLTTILKIMTN